MVATTTISTLGLLLVHRCRCLGESKGTVSGYCNGLFDPDAPITREQLAVMLWRYADNLSAINKKLNFSEAGRFALEAFQSSVENGIIAGYGDGRINSKGLAICA